MYVLKQKRAHASQARLQIVFVSPKVSDTARKYLRKKLVGFVWGTKKRSRLSLRLFRQGPAAAAAEAKAAALAEEDSDEDLLSSDDECHKLTSSDSDDECHKQTVCNPCVANNTGTTARAPSSPPGRKRAKVAARAVDQAKPCADEWCADLMVPTKEGKKWVFVHVCATCCAPLHDNCGWCNPFDGPGNTRCSEYCTECVISAIMGCEDHDLGREAELVLGAQMEERKAMSPAAGDDSEGSRWRCRHCGQLYRPHLRGCLGSSFCTKNGVVIGTNIGPIWRCAL